MEDIEDDRSEVLDAADVDRDGLQPLAHAASAAAKTTRTKGGFRHRMALLMLEMALLMLDSCVTTALA